MDGPEATLGVHSGSAVALRRRRARLYGVVQIAASAAWLGCGEQRCPAGFAPRFDQCVAHECVPFADACEGPSECTELGGRLQCACPTGFAAPDGGCSEARSLVRVYGGLDAASGGQTVTHIGSDLAINMGGELYAVGHFSGTTDFGTEALVSAGSTDGFIAKFDRDLNPLWVHRGLTTAGADTAKGVVLSSRGEVWTISTTTVVQPNLFDLHESSLEIAKWSAEGEALARLEIPVKSNFWSLGGRNIAVDSRDYAYAAFAFTGSVRVDEQTADTESGSDILLAKLSPEGRAVWLKRYGGTGLTVPLSLQVLSVDGRERLVIAGGYNGVLDVGVPAIGPDSGLADAFLLTLDLDGAPLSLATASTQDGRPAGFRMVIPNGERGFLALGLSLLPAGGGTSDVILGSFDTLGSEPRLHVFDAAHVVALTNLVWLDAERFFAAGVATPAALPGVDGGTQDPGDMLLATFRRQRDGYVLESRQLVGGSGLDAATSLEPSPDGKYLYVTGAIRGAARMGAMQLGRAGTDSLVLWRVHR